MDRPSWPDGGDLVQFLGDVGFDATAMSTSVDTYVSAAIYDFERATGRQPFVGTAQTRLFNPPGPNERRTRSNVMPMVGGGRRLHLDCGLVSLTSLKVGITIDNPTGTPYTVNRDFFLRPGNAAVEKRPYDLVEFLNPQYGQFQSIQIVGVWGWQATVPNDAWLAVLSRAAMLALPAMTGSKTGGVAKVTLGPNSFDFGQAGAFSNEKKQWQTNWNHAVGQYMRMDI